MKQFRDCDYGKLAFGECLSRSIVYVGFWVEMQQMSHQNLEIYPLSVPQTYINYVYRSFTTFN